VTLGELGERQFATPVQGALLRLHVGLEDVGALRRDLQQALHLRCSCRALLAVRIAHDQTVKPPNFPLLSNACTAVSTVLIRFL
jgi:hypothetical protein